MITEFQALCKYDKKKRGNTYNKRMPLMMLDMDKLFDIFCKDARQRRKLEVMHQLRMDERDFAFYSNQNGKRKSRALNIVENLTPSDIAFKRKTSKSNQLPTSATATATNFSISPSCSMPSDDSSSTPSDEDSASIASSTISLSNSSELEAPDDYGQNRKDLTNLVLMCERFQTSDRAGAAIADAVFKDYGVVDQLGLASLIDRSKLRRERAKYREKIREESALFEKVDGVYIDSKKDATLVINQKGGVQHRKFVLEEHYVLVGEPGEFYPNHISTKSGKGRVIAEGTKSAISNTSLEDTPAVIGTDGTAAMTGPHNGAIRCLEERLNKPLQWSVCLLHTNELPLRHVFLALDGKTKGPDSFSGPIGKKLNGDPSSWSVVDFDKIPNPNFPVLAQETIESLSSDQYYAYNSSLGVISGYIQDVSDLKIGPLCHARWLTLACRILRFY